MLARYDRTSIAGLLLSATVWQCEGDVLRAESTLRRAAETACDDERPYVIDLLVPLLISRGLFTRAAALLATTSSSKLELERTALKAVIDAANGAYGLSEELASNIRDALPRLDDDVLRLRIHQRLALAAYYRRDAAEALDKAAEGIRLARLLGTHRFACTLHSVAYATHHTCTGDAESTWHHATALVREATHGGDVSYRAVGRIAVYELAAERGDDDVLAEARAALFLEPLPEQYRERYPGGIADALRLAWAGDFATCRNVLTVLKDTAGRTDGERALCRAFLALIAIILDHSDAARRLSRQAISTSARPEKRLPAHEVRYRRLARALAAVAGDLVGDFVRGRRASEARFLQDDPDIALLVKLQADARLDDVPQTVRGYARLVILARQRLGTRPAAGPLTASEIEVLKLVAVGRNAPQIATLLGRSPHTVRTHLRNLGAKLEAHGRGEAVSRARQLGLL
ncbi:MAG: helix-turn-helix transcriptional regulator [Candidatus Eremiobacteraeota bacterium]|nr:helix-turn-helix transcriptional regulator [Candidatus Eremiobacteraeota bacterium]